MSISWAIRMTLVACISITTACSEPGPTAAPEAGPGEPEPPPPRATATSGAIPIVTSTSGSDFDADGYVLEIRRGEFHMSLPLATTGTVTASELAAGTYVLALEGIAANCDVGDGAIRQVAVADGTTQPITFDVACGPPADLAFVRDDQIFAIRSDGTGLVRLTNTEAGIRNSDPAWSPDGTRIAFVSDRDGTPALYMMNADGSNVVQRMHTAEVEAPAWSPDGQSIAFSSWQDGQFGIHVVSVLDDGSLPRLVGHTQGWNAYPAWSPDGHKIAFTSDLRAFDFLYDLYVMNADGSRAAPLVVGPFYWSDGLKFYFQPAWSPDGQTIALVACPYTADNCFPSSSISLVKADGTELRALAQSGGFSRPAWSADGRTIAFAVSPSRNVAGVIRYVRADGSQEGVIVANGTSPTWRP